jgi:hypothetical protein
LVISAGGKSDRAIAILRLRRAFHCSHGRVHYPEQKQRISVIVNTPQNRGYHTSIGTHSLQELYKINVSEYKFAGMFKSAKKNL